MQQKSDRETFKLSTFSHKLKNKNHACSWEYITRAFIDLSKFLINFSDQLPTQLKRCNTKKSIAKWSCPGHTQNSISSYSIVWRNFIQDTWTYLWKNNRKLLQHKFNGQTVVYTYSNLSFHLALINQWMKFSSFSSFSSDFYVFCVKWKL